MGYSSYSQLRRAEDEGRDYEVRIQPRPSPICIVAPHGGGIEPGTSELAEALAAERFACYTFNGTKPSHNWRLHITSSRFDEPRALALVRLSRLALTVHGCRGREQWVYMGGLAQQVANHIAASLVSAGFTTRPAIKHSLRGRHPLNICNRCTSGGGVQLELPWGLRRRLMTWQRGHARPTRRFWLFAAAIHNTLLQLKL